MSTRWAICPTDGRTHVLLPVGDHPLGMLQARCGHLLPQGVALHECLPGLRLCVTCLWCYLVPASAFPPHDSGWPPVERCPRIDSRRPAGSSSGTALGPLPTGWGTCTCLPRRRQVSRSRERVRREGEDQMVITRPTWSG